MILLPVGLLAAIAVWCVRRRYLLVTVQGASMSPALTGGERVLVRRSGPESLRRGDIVVVRWDTEEHKTRVPVSMQLIKRVVAIEGDPLPELIAAAAGLPADAPTPAGLFAVLADNLENSMDSRACGLFGAGNLIGVMARQPS
ncbi:S26 family signal peptidase [Kribbella sp. NPDC056861]|uniref:S26 family signal peptidase n=1 Tax=Kribbella sp. NPDC056861 TaxID=3154857 RepID=UPI003417010C